MKDRLACLALASRRACRSDSVRAQGLAPDDAGDPAKAKPGLLSKVGIDQHLNQQVPLDLVFNDETGREVSARRVLRQAAGRFSRWSITSARCCARRCSTGSSSALGVINFESGREFDVVAVSINPKETPALAAQKKQAYLDRTSARRAPRAGTS